MSTEKMRKAGEGNGGEILGEWVKEGVWVEKDGSGGIGKEEKVGG